MKNNIRHCKICREEIVIEKRTIGRQHASNSTIASYLSDYGKKVGKNWLCNVCHNDLMDDVFSSNKLKKYWNKNE